MLLIYWYSRKEKELSSKGYVLDMRSPVHRSSPVQPSSPAVAVTTHVADTWQTEHPFSHILRRELERSIRKHTRTGMFSLVISFQIWKNMDRVQLPTYTLSQLWYYTIRKFVIYTGHQVLVKAVKWGRLQWAWAWSQIGSGTFMAGEWCKGNNLSVHIKWTALVCVSHFLFYLGSLTEHPSGSSPQTASEEHLELLKKKYFLH